MQPIRLSLVTTETTNVLYKYIVEGCYFIDDFAAITAHQLSYYSKNRLGGRPEGRSLPVKI